MPHNLDEMCCQIENFAVLVIVGYHFAGFVSNG
jgi:hypothetical protein